MSGIFPQLYSSLYTSFNKKPECIVGEKSCKILSFDVKGHINISQANVTQNFKQYDGI